MDKKPEKLVPEVRFKGFTDDWEQHKLGEISFKVNTKNKENLTLPVLSNSAEYGIVNQEDYFDKKIANRTDNYYIVKHNDFVYNPRISKKAPYGPIRRNTLDTKGLMSPLYYVFRINDGNYIYLDYYFKSSKWYKFMYQNGDSGARSDRFAIKDKIFQMMPINMPNTKEQNKIGQLIQTLQKLIDLQQRKLEQLKRLKKAMLQQLFANNNSKQPNLRFKNFKGDWEQCKLGELIESLFQGINTAADKVEYSNNGLPIIQAKNITSGSLDFSGSRKLSVQKYSNYLDKYIPQKGDILFANIGTIGPNVILKDTRQFFIAWNILRIVPQKNINGEFLKITLDLLNSKHYFEKLLTGNATKFVNKNDMRNLPIFFSDPEEQNKISNLFKKLDFLITLQQNKLTQLTTLKKYLLQKMFI